MRPIDADELKNMKFSCAMHDDDYIVYVPMREVNENIDKAPTIGGWISVKDGTPDEHDSIFAKHPHMSKYMWAKESDDVIVYVRFPDGSGRSTEGRLRDGKWYTKISPSLEPVVTHWMPLPGPPEET